MDTRTGALDKKIMGSSKTPLAVQARQGLEGRRRRSRKAGMEWVGSHGTPESPSKMASLPFFLTSFLSKTCLRLLQTFDAPSMALCVLQKWQGVLLGRGSFAGKSAAKKILEIN